MTLVIINKDDYELFEVKKCANILGSFDDEGPVDEEPVCYSLEEDRLLLHTDVAILKDHVPGQRQIVKYPSTVRYFAIIEEGKAP